MRALRTFLNASTAAFYALPAMAADAELKPTGLPQLDTSKFPEQLFWLAISFALLYALMAFVALPGVRRTQDKRQATLSSELAAATAANDQAKAMMAEADKAMADARSQAQAAMNDIKAQAAKASAERQTAQQKELHRRLHEAEAKITASRDAAMRDAQKAASELASAIVEKITGMKAQA